MLSTGRPFVPNCSWFSESLISSPHCHPARHSLTQPTHADSRLSQRSKMPTHATALPAHAPQHTSDPSGRYKSGLRSKAPNAKRSLGSLIWRAAPLRRFYFIVYLVCRFCLPPQAENSQISTAAMIASLFVDNCNHASVDFACLIRFTSMLLSFSHG